MVVELRPHQEETIDKLDYGRILYGGVGSGKTITSVAFYFTKVMGGVLNDPTSLRRPCHLIVITTAKVRDGLDWQKTAAKFHIFEDPNDSLPGTSITVDSWNNIKKYTEVEDAFFVFDEQRLVGSGAWVKSFYKIARSNRWILLSATPGDTWHDFLPVFVANGWFKNKTEFEREHVVWQPYTKFPKVLRYTGVNKLVKLKNKVLVEMPFERHTTRHIQDVPVDYDLEMFNKAVKQRWHPFEERPIRDVAELFHVMRKVVNSDASRVEAVRKLWQKHPKLIVFYNFNYELEQLRKLAQNPPSPLNLISSAESSTSKKRSTSGPDYPLETSKESLTKNLGESEWESNSEAKSGTASATSTAKSRSQQSSTKLSLVKSSPNTSASASVKKSSYATDKPSTERSGLSKDRDYSNLSSTEPVSKNSIGFESSPSSVDLSTPNSNTSSATSTLATSIATVAESNGIVSTSGTPGPTRKNCSAAVAEWNGHKHEPIPETDSWLYLVQYQAGAEGWNCIETDAMVFYSLTYSYKNFMQAQGRIDRLNTPFEHLKYYVLMSASMIDKAVRRSLNEKKNFNERRFYEKAERKAA